MTLVMYDKINHVIDIWPMEMNGNCLTYQQRFCVEHVIARGQWEIVGYL